MHVLLGEVNADWYLANTVLLVFVIVVHIIGLSANKYRIPEIVETPMILHDKKRRDALYRMRSLMIFAVSLPLLALNILFFLTDKSGVYAFFITVLIALSVIAYFIALVVYTDIQERSWAASLGEKGAAQIKHEFSFQSVRSRSIARAAAIALALFFIGYILFRIYRL